MKTDHFIENLFFFSSLFLDVIIRKSSDICTTICDNFDDNFYLLSSYWSKTIEREKRRDRLRI
jgi:hypothetical protein